MRKVGAKLTTTMNTDITASRNSLHDILKARNIFILQNEIDDARSIRIALINRIRQIALQRPRVIIQRVRNRLRDTTGQTQGSRSQVDLHASERTGSHSTTTGASGQMEVRQTGLAAEHDVAGLGDLKTVSAHGGCGAVEDGGSLEARFGGLGPVPVGLRAFVAAFVAEGLLILPGEEAVPGEEGTLL